MIYKIPYKPKVLDGIQSSLVKYLVLKCDYKNPIHLELKAMRRLRRNFTDSDYVLFRDEIEVDYGG